MFSPYPGSELYEKLKKEKKLKIDDNYFKKLMVYMDITQSQSYSEHVSGTMLIFLRFVGFSLSYIVIYLSRLYRLFRNFFRKDFFPNNLFEQRVYDYYVRLKLTKTVKSNQ